MIPLFLTFNVIIEESDHTDRKSMRNVKEITCGCDTRTCIARKSQRMCRKIVFQYSRQLEKFLVQLKSTVIHTETVIHKRHQTNKCIAEKETKCIREFVMYLSGGGYFYLSKCKIHINIWVMLYWNMMRCKHSRLFFNTQILPCSLVYR